MLNPVTITNNSIPVVSGKPPVNGEIHVWYAWLDKLPSGFLDILSMDERERVWRFYHKEDRIRFINRRGILRTLLGHYLNTEPARIRYRYGRNNKPFLAGSAGKGGLHFNVSHSENLAAFAFTRLGEIGIDIEYTRDITDIMRIADEYFSTGETSALAALPGEYKKQGFYNCWTRKEAFIKATGDGLSCPLDGFEVSLAPGEPVRLLSIGNDPDVAGEWVLHQLELPPGFAGALAAKGKVLNIRFRGWLD